MILLSKVFPTLDCASCISTPEDGGVRSTTRTSRTLHLQRGRRDRAGRRRPLQREDHAEGAVRRRGRLHRLPEVRDRVHRVACPTSSTRTWSLATRPTSPSRRRCPRRRSSSGPARRRARSPARPGSRPTATCRSSAAASTRRRSSSSSTRRRSSARSGAPATRRARSTARAARSRARCRSVGSSASSPTSTTTDFDGPGVEIPEPNGHRVAIVGSGPAGLTAAWQLARKGYGVKIFEAAPKAGGFLRLAIPAYRLPSEVVERDIANVTALGVEIAVERAGRGPRRPPQRRLRRRPRGDRDAAARPGWACPATSSTASSAASPSCAP